MTRDRLIFAILSLFLLLGCVGESRLFSEREHISDYKEFDSNGDLKNDLWFYTFKPVEVGDQVYSQRALLVTALPEGGYTYKTIVTVTNNNPDTLLTELILTERVPPDLTRSLSDVSFDVNYTSIVKRDPLIFEWRAAGIGTGANTSFAYTVRTQLEPARAWVEQNVFTPDVVARTGNPLVSPIFVFFTNLANGFFLGLQSALGFYPAVAIFSSLAFIIVYLLLWNLARFVYYLLIAIKNRRTLKSAVYEMAGRGEQNNKLYVGVGVLLVVLGFGAMYALPKPAGVRDISEIVGAFSADPLPAAAAFLGLLGILALVFVAEDFLKGRALGRRYYEAVSRPEELQAAMRESETIERIQHLHDEVNDALKKVQVLANAGFEVGGETAKLEAIDGGLEQAEEKAMKKKLEEAQEIYIASRQKWDESKKGINAKVAKVTALQGEIQALYKAKGEVDALSIEAESLGVNVEAAKKKVQEVDVEELVEAARKKSKAGKFDEAAKAIGPKRRQLEEAGRAIADLLKAKKKLKPVEVSRQKFDDVMKMLVTSGKIEAAALVRRDGLMVASKLPESADKNVIAAMSARMLDRAEMVSGELGEGAVQYVLTESTQGRTISMDVGNSVVLICLTKPKEDTGFVIIAMQNARSKISKLFEGA